MLLNNKWVNNQIKEEIKRYFETNENEDTTTQNLWDIGKAILREIHSISSLSQKQEKAQYKSKFTLKGT